MQYSTNRKYDIQRVFVGATRCLNPVCNKPLKYAKNKRSKGHKGYCCLECKLAYTPTMVYFSRVYARPFREVLIYLLNRYRYKSAVAQDLGVMPKTVGRWMKQMGIKKSNGVWI